MLWVSQTALTDATSHGAARRGGVEDCVTASSVRQRAAVRERYLWMRERGETLGAGVCQSKKCLTHTAMTDAAAHGLTDEEVWRTV